MHIGKFIVEMDLEYGEGMNLELFDDMTVAQTNPNRPNHTNKFKKLI